MAQQASSPTPELPLAIDTDVSAKYRGAWCEGSIKHVQRALNIKVTFDGNGGSHVVKQEQIRGSIKLNAAVQAQHPTTGTWNKATINRINDASVYTVRFHDGDERQLKRGSVTLMGPAHYEDGQTLGDFPLTDPEFFADEAAQEDGPRKRRRESGNLNPDGAPLDAPSPPPSAVKEAPIPSGTVREVVLVQNEEGEMAWPAMVVPQAEVTKAMLSGEACNKARQLVVRFFEDNLYSIIEATDARVLKRGTKPFVDQLRNASFQQSTAVQRALRYLDRGVLPSGFKWDTWREDGIVTTPVKTPAPPEPEPESPTIDWTPDPVEEGKFKADYAAYCQLKGIKIKRPPVLSFKDLDLFRLFTLVQREGGSASVYEKHLWKSLYMELGFKTLPTSGIHCITQAYEKYLSGFEKHKAELANPAPKPEPVDPVADAVPEAVIAPVPMETPPRSRRSRREVQKEEPSPAPAPVVAATPPPAEPAVISDAKIKAEEVPEPKPTPTRDRDRERERRNKRSRRSGGARARAKPRGSTTGPAEEDEEDGLADASAPPPGVVPDEAVPEAMEVDVAGPDIEPLLPAVESVPLMEEPDNDLISTPQRVRSRDRGANERSERENDPSITAETPEYELLFQHSIGSCVRAMHKDGKFYQATIVRRGLHVSAEPSKQARYLVHFNNWGSRFDDWVDDTQIRTLAQSPRRSRNGKRDRAGERARRRRDVGEEGALDVDADMAKESRPKKPTQRCYAIICRRLKCYSPGCPVKARLLETKGRRAAVWSTEEFNRLDISDKLNVLRERYMQHFKALKLLAAKRRREPEPLPVALPTAVVA
eukprot:m.24631 g.24631  ORF g.24631 m.24631 type:complete len:821 (+) comp4039_c0_seq1:114-2576(+)